MLTGIFPPLTTPFDEDGDVDLEGLRENVLRSVAHGVRGVVAAGSTGEAPLLGDDEADRVIEATRSARPRDRVLIAGTGRESTRATIAASRRAGALGADAVLVRTPSYFQAADVPDARERVASLLGELQKFV